MRSKYNTSLRSSVKKSMELIKADDNSNTQNKRLMVLRSSTQNSKNLPKTLDGQRMMRSKHPIILRSTARISKELKKDDNGRQKMRSKHIMVLRSSKNKRFFELTEKKIGGAVNDRKTSSVPIGLETSLKRLGIKRRINDEDETEHRKKPNVKNKPSEDIENLAIENSQLTVGCEEVPVKEEYEIKQEDEIKQELKFESQPSGDTANFDYKNDQLSAECGQVEHDIKSEFGIKEEGTVKEENQVQEEGEMNPVQELKVESQPSEYAEVENVDDKIIQLPVECIHLKHDTKLTFETEQIFEIKEEDPVEEENRIKVEVEMKENDELKHLQEPIVQNETFEEIVVEEPNDQNGQLPIEEIHYYQSIF